MVVVVVVNNGDDEEELEHRRRRRSSTTPGFYETMEQFKLNHAGHVHVTHEAVHFHEIKIPETAVSLVKELRNCIIAVTLTVGIVTIVRGSFDRRRPPSRG